MRHIATVAVAVIGAAGIAHAAEVCLSCQEPAATYLCTVEQPSEKYALGSTLEQEMCGKVLAKSGGHKKCQLVQVPEGGTCEGARRTVTLTDYQRAIGNAAESTYEEGALEVARRNVHNTWLCVLSMFKDC